MKLAHTDRSVLEFVAGQRGSVMRDATFWNGVRRSAATRLIRRGLLTERTYANGSAYEITTDGRCVLDGRSPELERSLKVLLGRRVSN